MKVQPSKLPYLAHNACSAIAWPSWYLWIAGPMSGWSDMLMWPHYFDIPICWCSRQLFYQTVKFLQCCAVPNWGLQWARDVGQKQKSLEMIRWPEVIRSDWEWSGKALWPRWHVAQSCDHLLTVRKWENTCIVSYGAHQCARIRLRHVYNKEPLSIWVMRRPLIPLWLFQPWTPQVPPTHMVMPLSPQLNWNMRKPNSGLIKQVTKCLQLVQM